MKRKIIQYLIEKLAVLNDHKQKFELEKLQQLSTNRIENDIIIGKETYFHTTGESVITIKEKVSIRDFCTFRLHPNAFLIIEENVFINSYCSLTSCDKISIGKNTMLGEGVKIYDHNHKINKKEDIFIYRDKYTSSSVFIGQNCWIGSNVTILKGVNIGNNCVIGANCLVFKSIPDNSVVKCNTDLLITSLA